MKSSREHIQRAYDAASDTYAEQFLNELDHKPLDQKLLRDFSERVTPGGHTLDIGCDPGHTTAVLNGHGLNVRGVDLSPRMIERASREFPNIDFEVGNLFALNMEDSSVAGIVAFYAIVHLTPDELPQAFSEFERVLTSRSPLLISFHAGTKTVHADDFLDSGFSLDFQYFDPDYVASCLDESGFVEIKQIQRDAYETEYPSQRCYVTAQKQF